LGDLPLRFAPLVDGLRADPDRLLWAQFGLAALFVLLPATLMGAVFPLTVRMASTAAVGRSVAAVYTWNTLGSITGSLAASFVLVPALGLAGAVKAAAAVNLALAGLLVRPPLAAVGALVGLGLAWAVPAWNAKVLASGAFLYGAADLRSARGQSLELRDYLEKDTELLGAYWDAYGLVTVHRQRDGLLTMRVNGKADASTGPSDRPNMDFTGHLPLMHHPAPRRALLIGLGGGLTLEAMRKHPLERIDCVDISRAVVAGAKHFPEAERSLADPRVRMVVGDGRSLVAFAREPYDVIVSQPSNLWVSGMAGLFTRDFFEEVRGALAPGGVFGQWVHAYWLSPDDFRTVLRTFFAVFPEGSLWEVFPGSDYVLVAGPPVLHRTELLSEHVVGALDDYRIGDAAAARRFAGEGPVVTDDRCTLEYTAPKALYRDLRADLLKGLDAFRTDNARRAIARAVSAFAERRPTHAIRDLPSALDPRARLFADEVAAAVIEVGARRRDRADVAGAAQAFGLVPRSSGRYAEAQVELGDLRAQSGDPGEATAAFLRAREADPRSFGAAVGLALLHRARGENERAAGYLEQAVEIRPDSVPAWLELAEVRLVLGRLDAARDAARRILALDPSNARASALLGP
ncbi:MAG TPA: tetratricopeptide repeat protein, partial [Planctomycetota bacterium]|nr:tetratricopeptide repeat protein [Planctomycetota bacterium]